MSNDVERSESEAEAEKAAREWLETCADYTLSCEAAFLAGVEWERKKLLELARSHTTICGDPYFEMQLNRLIDRKEGGE